MSGRNLKWLFYALIMLLILAASVLLALSVGEVTIKPTKLISYLFNHSGMDNLEYMLLSQIRFPRIILAIAVGGALSLSGVILQGIYRNPLVEPYTLGISGGASLGVAIVIVLGLHLSLGSFVLPLAGFAGAVFIIFLVYTISSYRGGINIHHMLLIGVMISFIASSAMMFLMAVTSSENLQGIIFWIMGSLSEANSNLIYTTLIIALIVLFLSYLFVQPLNALRLGEEKARHLGINTNVSIKILFLLASLLAGISVAVAGVIGFVGLIIPHILRIIFGSDYRILLFSSFIIGASFMVLSDLIARTIIAPIELPIGVITGIIGGSIFIILMRRKFQKI